MAFAGGFFQAPFRLALGRPPFFPFCRDASDLRGDLREPRIPIALRINLESSLVI